MKGYLIRVHPQLPILDEVDMVEVLRSGGPAMNDMPDMSIFVLHAMIHVACSVRTDEKIGRPPILMPCTVLDEIANRTTGL